MPVNAIAPPAVGHNTFNQVPAVGSNLKNQGPIVPKTDTTQTDLQAATLAAQLELDGVALDIAISNFLSANVLMQLSRSFALTKLSMGQAKDVYEGYVKDEKEEDNERIRESGIAEY